MGGLFLIYLVIEFWPVAVAGIALFVAVFVLALILDAQSDRQARLRREAADLLRHQRARAEIDRIAMATSRAMSEAAFLYGHDVIEAAAVEVGADE